MKTSRLGLKGVVKLAAFILCGLMLLASVSAFRESAVLGYALVAVPVLLCGVAMFNSVRKSVWGLAFLVLGLGMLEIYLGVAKECRFHGCLVVQGLWSSWFYVS